MLVTTFCTCGEPITGHEHEAGRELRCPACEKWCELPEPAVIAALTGDDFARIQQQSDSIAKLGPVVSEEWADISRNAEITMPEESPRRPSAELAYADVPFKPIFRGVARLLLGIGLLLMASGFFWFVAGLVSRSLSYYPPILFIAGLFAFLKSVFDVNLAGGVSSAPGQMTVAE